MIRWAAPLRADRSRVAGRLSKQGTHRRTDPGRLGTVPHMTRVRSPRRGIGGSVGALAVSAGFVLAACGGGSDDGADVAAPATEPAAQPADDAAPASESESGGVVGDAPEILQFTAGLVGGGDIDASELAGSPTLFWFWSPT